MFRNVLHWLAVPLLVAGFTLGSSTTRATLVIEMGDGPAQTNIGFEQTTSNTATGYVVGQGNTLGSPVLFVETDTGLDVQGPIAAAFIEAVGTNFSTVDITPFTGILGFTSFELLPAFDPGPSPDSGTIVISAFDQFDSTNPAATLTLNVADINGNLRFSVVGSDNQVITRVLLEADPALIDTLRQFRTGDVEFVTPVPEPSTLISGILALALSGGVFAMRRKRTLRHGAAA